MPDRPRHASPYQRERARQLLGALAEMAHADGEVDARERRFLYGVATSHGLPAGDVDTILARGRQAPSEAPALERATCVTVLRHLIVAMHADGVVTPKELGVVRRYGRGLGVREDALDDFVDLAMVSGREAQTGHALAVQIEACMGESGGA